MWIDGVPNMKRKRKRKIKWNKGTVKAIQEQRGPKTAKKAQNEKEKEE